MFSKNSTHIFAPFPADPFLNSHFSISPKDEGKRKAVNVREMWGWRLKEKKQYEKVMIGRRESESWENTKYEWKYISAGRVRICSFSTAMEPMYHPATMLQISRKKFFFDASGNDWFVVILFHRRNILECASTHPVLVGIVSDHRSSSQSRTRRATATGLLCDHPNIQVRELWGDVSNQSPKPAFDSR